MPTNNKNYMREYMKKYNKLDKTLEYKMSYYYQNRERLKKLQREYYHKYKNDETKSHYLQKRLKLQRDNYAEEKGSVRKYECKGFYKTKNFYSMRINKGEYIIEF